MEFNYGFIIENITYVWYRKELYRLPYTKNNRSYNFKKLKPLLIGSTKCYTIGNKKFTINKIKVLTKKFKETLHHNIIDNKLPF